MLEFYMSYATFEDLMLLTEELFTQLLSKVKGKTIIEYQGSLSTSQGHGRGFPSSTL